MQEHLLCRGCRLHKTILGALLAVLQLQELQAQQESQEWPAMQLLELQREPLVPEAKSRSQEQRLPV